MCDVAIVGASVAGCTAAILFARAGVKVTLLERNSDPLAYKRVCTHFLQPSTIPILDRLGLTSQIEAVGGMPNNYELWTRWGWIRHSNEFVRHGYNIRRETLDPMLRTIAAETPGVTFMPGSVVSDVVAEHNQVVGIRALQGSQPREVRARLVVAADGQASRVAEHAGLGARTKPNGRFLYFAHYLDLPLVEPGLTQIWLGEPDLAYSFPNDGGYTVLAAAPAQPRLENWKRDIEANFIETFEALPRAPRVREGKRATPFFGSVKLPSQSRQVTAPGLALIGDAALATDPIWGTGCGWAFRSAEWLVDSVALALRQGGSLSAALNTYRRRHSNELAGHAWLIADFASGRPFNALERLMFSAAARNPACADHLLAFAGREIGVSRFVGPSALGRALKANVVHHLGRRAQYRPAALS